MDSVVRMRLTHACRGFAQNRVTTNRVTTNELALRRFEGEAS